MRSLLKLIFRRPLSGRALVYPTGERLEEGDEALSRRHSIWNAEYRIEPAPGKSRTRNFTRRA